MGKDEEVIYDFIFSRYHNAEYILNLDYSLGAKIILEGFRKAEEDRFFMKWVVQLPYQDSENFVSFESYMDKVTGKNITYKSTKEIIDDVKNIREQLGVI